jgi:shikimate dehydrogenase
VLGAGGASLAIVDALVAAFPELELTWVSRRPGRVPCIDAIPGAAERVHPCSWTELAPRGELLINTTVVGLDGGPDEFPVAIELDGLEPGAQVIDIVYPRPPGGLLDRAEAAGLAVQDGRPMLLWQGVRALELWLDLVLPNHVIDAMRAALHPPDGR